MTYNARPEPDYQALEFDYTRSPDQDAPVPARHPVIVVGAGPVGLALAIDLAQRGIRVLLLDNDHKLAHGSRAICFSKRTLEIFDRLGCGQRLVDKGVSWNRGRVFFKDQPVYSFDLLPEEGHERPAFINLQQYYLEGYLVERAMELPNLEIRWRNAVSAVVNTPDGVTLTVDTPDGPYSLRADWLAACDGSRSTLRGLLGQEVKGRVFRDRFLIADIKVNGVLIPSGATERWFWFDPPFHPRQSVLLHRQPDNVWRVDFQLGWDTDPDEEKKPEHVLPRVRALLAHGGLGDADFSLQWASVYTFACTRMEHFRHGRVFFVGDAAHGVSPFGARGANSGVQDAENLAWKLARVIGGDASGAAAEALLDSYATERECAADENLLNSTRATDFITPKSEVSRLFRDAVLTLSRDHAFARRLVNSGRLSVPCVLRDSPLNTPDTDTFDGLMAPGATAADAPLRCGGADAWLLRRLGHAFTLLVFGAAPAWAGELPVRTLAIDGKAALDRDGCLQRRYDATPGTAYLLRPDQHVCARWRHPSAAAVRAALARATCEEATA